MISKLLFFSSIFLGFPLASYSLSEGRTVEKMPVVVISKVNQNAPKHVVLSGDTISSIAKLYNVGQKDLISLNKLKNVDHLVLGQVLKLPQIALITRSIDPLTGPRVQLPSYWVGTKKVSKSLAILVMAGHADSQGIGGAGTPGESVDLKGASPMDLNMRDELYWNLRIRDAVVKLGQEKGLNIISYEPGNRNIVNENDPRTNWSAGYRHAQKGGYVFEIHFDAYGKYGFGSGLIPALSVGLNLVDESLAQTFGRYPHLFRGGLGAARRQIRILEVGKLGGVLEQKLRDTATREKTLNQISERIVNALLKGVGRLDPA